MVDIKAKVVLMDVEGTTTSISFVQDVLVPYAKQHVRNYMTQHWKSNELYPLFVSLGQIPQYKEFLNGKMEPISVDILTKFAFYLMDKDIKTPPLKTLQGYIWERGFNDGTINAHIYHDVPAEMEKWHKAGITLAIYSSGSIAAQKLLFSNTSFGNLCRFIKTHFDTQSGPKQSVESYKNIARDLRTAPKDVVFLTDSPAEADAAVAAGMQTIIIHRTGNPGLTDDQKARFKVIDDFKKIRVTKP